MLLGHNFKRHHCYYIRGKINRSVITVNYARTILGLGWFFSVLCFFKLCFFIARVQFSVSLLCVCALPGKAIPKMTYTVSGGTLNPTHSFAHCYHILGYYNSGQVWELCSDTNNKLLLVVEWENVERDVCCRGIWFCISVWVMLNIWHMSGRVAVIWLLIFRHVFVRLLFQIALHFTILVLKGIIYECYVSGMCTRPSEPRPRQNWDVQNFVRDETLQLLRRWPRPWSSRDSRESRELQRLTETFFVTWGETHWQWKKYTY